VPTWDCKGTPPQPDYYISLRCAETLGMDVFTLEDLPRDPWTRRRVKEWAIVRMKAEAQAATWEREAAAKPTTPDTE
jgi:hypothetical protein